MHIRLFLAEYSTADNIRPMVVEGKNMEAVLWLRGRYTSYRDYDLDVYGLIREQL